MLPITDTRPPTGNHERPALVMSHSFAFSRREWMEVAGLLAGDFRTITIDMPGFGDAHDIPGYTMQEMAKQFAQVILELGLVRYVLVGHSMTGKVLSILASTMGKSLGLQRTPERLILVTPTPLGQEIGGEDMRRALLALHKTREDAETFVTNHTGLSLPPNVHERAIEDYLKTNRAAWEA